MVEILCPHCVEEIQLDDDASGVFACPHCDGEFGGNIRPEVEQLAEEDNLLLTVVSGFFREACFSPASPFLWPAWWTSFSSTCGVAGEGSTDNLGGIGVVVVMLC